MLECDACEDEATHSFNLKYSITKNVRHKACKKHYKIALNKIRVFLKHVRRKANK